MYVSDFEKNDISAKNQVGTFKLVESFYKENSILKIMFVGNSITRHDICLKVGWDRDCGMAASCKEKDYVHQTVTMLEKKYGNTDYCIVQAADWERNFDNQEILKKFSKAKEFDADILVIRIGENTDREKLKIFDYACFFEKMVDYFRNDHCKTVITSLFWRFDPIDLPIQGVAKKRNFSYIPLYDLGARAEYKAIEEFGDNGTGHHPNDNGMKCIAERIVSAINK